MKKLKGVFSIGTNTFNNIEPIYYPKRSIDLINQFISELEYLKKSEFCYSNIINDLRSLNFNNITEIDFEYFFQIFEKEDAGPLEKGSIFTYEKIVGIYQNFNTFQILKLNFETLEVKLETIKESDYYMYKSLLAKKNEDKVPF